MQDIRHAERPAETAQLFLVLFVSACALLATAIGVFPLQMSIATIFLFAGVHNVMEFRYFAARMPLRWGKSKTFYSVGIAGVAFLSAAYILLYFSTGNWLWSVNNWDVLAASWNTAFIVWVGLLFLIRGRHRSLDWSWAVPISIFLASLAWLAPQYWSLSLVYLHPFVAMWFLERQIRRTKPEWLRAYHFCLLSVPIFLLILWALLARHPDLSQDSSLFWRITQHAGSEILPGISSRLLVATHVFLETIHYAVWIVLIPLVDRKAIPWRLERIPLFAHRNGYPKLVALTLSGGVAIVVLLWFGFGSNYLFTRDMYFTFAIAHVMAEFPFLVKML